MQVRAMLITDVITKIGTLGKFLAADVTTKV